MERVTHQDYSITKPLNPDGTDLEVILITQKSLPFPSLMVTKIAHLLSILILQPQKEERNSRKNGMLSVKWLQNFSPKKT
jgi:hypothetical protein